MNRAIDYIESNLTEAIDLSNIAHVACSSSYQFQRMFSFVTDVTLAEYIRRRRLTLAALELQQNKSLKVIDIALKYQYESPVSFARAFYSVHGISPTQARNKGTQLKAYPRLTFSIFIKGVEPMNYRIETLDSFEVFGIEQIFKINASPNDELTPAKFWEKSHANGEVKRLEANAGSLPNFINQNLYPVNALCSYRQTGADTFPYMLCAFKDEASKTEGYKSVTIPAMTWVIFNSEPHTWDQFDETIKTLYSRFYTEWLPTSGYEQVDGIEFEMYGQKDGQNYLELWFGVRKA